MMLKDLLVLVTESDWALSTIPDVEYIKPLEQYCEKVKPCDVPITFPKLLSFIGRAYEDELCRICESSIPSFFLVWTGSDIDDNLLREIGNCLEIMTSTNRSTSTFLARHTTQFLAFLDHFEIRESSVPSLTILSWLCFSPNLEVSKMALKTLNSQSKPDSGAYSFLRELKVPLPSTARSSKLVPFAGRLCSSLAAQVSQIQSLFTEPSSAHPAISAHSAPLPGESPLLTENIVVAIIVEELSLLKTMLINSDATFQKILVDSEYVYLLKYTIVTCLDLLRHLKCISNCPADRSAALTQILDMSWSCAISSVSHGENPFRPEIEYTFSNIPQLCSLVELTCRVSSPSSHQFLMIAAIIAIFPDLLPQVLEENVVQRVINISKPMVGRTTNAEFHRRLVCTFVILICNYDDYTQNKDKLKRIRKMQFERVLRPAKHYLHFVLQREEYILQDDSSDEDQSTLVTDLLARTWTYSLWGDRNPTGLQLKSSVEMTNVIEVPDGYSFVKPISSGGFGSVVEMMKNSTRKHYAGKMIPCVTPKDNERIDHEVNRLRKFVHPGIVQLKEVVSMGNLKVIVMELGGQSLAEIMKDYTERKVLMPRDAVYRVMVDITSALAMMHSEEGGRTAHRDVKMENILLFPGGHFKLCDLGATESEVESSTRSVMSQQYVSPERIESETGKATCSSDVWALGIVLHWLLFGEPPFKSKSLLKLGREIESFRVSMIGSGCGGEERALLMRILDPNPVTRVTSCQLGSFGVFRCLVNTKSAVWRLKDADDRENKEKARKSEKALEMEKNTLKQAEAMNKRKDAELNSLKEKLDKSESERKEAEAKVSRLEQQLKTEQATNSRLTEEMRERNETISRLQQDKKLSDDHKSEHQRLNCSTDHSGHSFVSFEFGTIVARLSFIIKTKLKATLGVGIISSSLSNEALMDYFPNLKGGAGWELHPNGLWVRQHYKNANRGSACLTGREGQRVVLEADGREGKRTLKLSQDGETQPFFFTNIPVPFRFANRNHHHGPLPYYSSHRYHMIVNFSSSHPPIDIEKAKERICDDSQAIHPMMLKDLLDLVTESDWALSTIPDVEYIKPLEQYCEQVKPCDVPV
ncbi:putative CBL-interacting protein kinase 3 [Blattamonas nauphoetae]|uniref:CBL-interacting protein kinase 3 n=1 Tax=Blattamonas nauphoetae TaxID=2049346 RepID=A0ABQ9XSP1_9EUKA|nr:putative CBL-interacting protein kinase 3 [Blattamonas nauphoetae]